ncbi:MAG: TIGR01212 family radical SAM protein [Candidatus Hydrothermia bacterium]|nr:TIGR01212 family radical SAM protein [Candidatus Hydrothermia bacterium]
MKFLEPSGMMGTAFLSHGEKKMFEEWGGKRYNSFNYHLKSLFGEKVYKVALDAGFTCPNRDGSIGTGGCIFCDAGGSRAGYVDPDIPVEDQLIRGMEAISRQTGAKKFIAYFQAFSNTYAPIKRLEALYRSVVKFDEVVGISISTRPDLVPNEILDLIEDIAKEKYLWLELGVQTMKDETLRFLNRGHSVAENIDAIKRAKARPNTRVLAHVIIGLPGESEEEILSNARSLSLLGIDGIKIHHLYVVENTLLASLYEKGEIKLFENVDEFADIAAKFLEHLSPNVIIHRLQGFARSGLIAPAWTSNKFIGVQKIEELLEVRNTFQGRNFNR